MYIIKVNSEWDLGIPEYYESEDLASIHVRAAVSEMEDDLEMSYEECIDDGYISYEVINVVMESDDAAQQ